MTTLCTLNNVCLGYQAKPLVHQISGILSKGDMVAVVGGNGQGKSTLLKALTGENAPLSGKIIWHQSLKPHQVGYLTQSSLAGKEFPLTVIELVTMGAWASLGLFKSVRKSIKQKIDIALETVGLSAHKNALVHTLSGGQFQRALFARLMVQDPEIIFLDEPFNALDQQTRQTLEKVVLDWHQQQKTLVVILHDLDFVRQNFPTVLLLQKGQMTGWGKTQDLLPSVCSHPRHISLVT